jgi:hypothetical protein
MNGRIIWKLLSVLLVLVCIVAVGAFAFNAGMAQGLAADGKALAPSQGYAPFAYHHMFFPFLPFGFVVGGLLFPLLFVCLIFALIRGIFGHHHSGAEWHHRHWDKDFPPMFDEWHRKAHESQTPPEPKS